MLLLSDKYCFKSQNTYGCGYLRMRGINPAWLSLRPTWRKDTGPKCPSKAVGTPHTAGTSISHHNHWNFEKVPWKDFGMRKKMQAEEVTLNIPAAHDLRVVQPTACAMPTYFTKSSVSSLLGRYIFTLTLEHMPYAPNSCKFWRSFHHTYLA